MLQISFALKASVVGASVNVSWDLVMAWAKASWAPSCSIVPNNTSTATASPICGDQPTPPPVTVTTSLMDDYLVPTGTIASSMCNYSTPTAAVPTTSLVDHDLPSSPPSAAAIPRPGPFTPSDNYGEMPPSAGAMIRHIIAGGMFYASIGILLMMSFMITGGAVMLALYGLGLGIHCCCRRLKAWWLQRRLRRHSTLLAAAE